VPWSRFWRKAPGAAASLASTDAVYESLIVSLGRQVLFYLHTHSGHRDRTRSSVPIRIKFKFDPDKAVEAILYVANRVKDPGFHRISKILYFADRQHLADYGRFICGDSYVAMKHGPVPSGAYDILKHVRGDGVVECPVPHAMESFGVEDEKLIVPYRNAVEDMFSNSERACLDAAIKQYGQMSFGKLADVSHDEAWLSADENDLMEVEQIAATLPDAEELLEHLRDPHPD
jgi:uncharacterized phage-associated protein